ncbi:hypothetical protein CLV62_101246 [Dysgonomonas alginatilytica]|uniref:Uncharacterized protein n=1 Tax=Dysgonomonas alginatilytica TaxID=1605892 RepID=A0A2V3PTE5_9BACT|nr:hypothetical protein [Dysgonomonas alginatilytica]PXV68980.1 hypothetical protein CLV62_101246 [Dysgonomonas alginatilytica]
MKVQLIAIFTLFSSLCNGQAVSENDSLRLIKEKNEQLLNYKLQQGTNDLEKRSPLDENTSLNYRVNMESSLNRQPEASDISIAIHKKYQGPMHEYLANPIGNPFADDYRYDAAYRITGRDWLSTTSSHTTYPSLGSMSLIGINYNYQFSDRLRGSAGTYGTRYFHLMDINYDFGVNSSLRYELSNRFAVLAFGQYSARANINKVGGDNGWMMPQTHYGAGGEFKLTDRIGIQGGVMRELNPMTGKWKTIPFIAPVFYKKKSN